jgi:antitoxin (DNA-binding transcriptional repressor) of toxin-antitoxin stability system
MVHHHSAMGVFRSRANITRDATLPGGAPRTQLRGQCTARMVTKFGTGVAFCESAEGLLPRQAGPGTFSGEETDMEREIPIDDHKDLAALVEEAAGEDVILTRNGHEVARIVVSPQERAKAAIAHMRELRKGATLGPDLTIRQLIDEGRKY